ncbi:isocitrate lyase/PEP mutase family protein [Rhodococcus sp. BP-252]|uniref:isocitrate lyase/PEP mutase family protein n=1 Tax=unclassified Rhodococcus (in: high G+C Gram-positive bacteria) TaxID=192944 RepID=UPI000DF133E2|nr:MULTISPECIES: isocitrate lyase/PEP mutase family protein [unclassified Rhodococcus (in: high G+C Gram-positive bacteria)]MBY6413486.1 isocitrate lyase/PEP mutase family protein [Rhodococcus sp. BP-320]MBY6418180.1 isocitrate lyase/PEP mutase family protein [Rhodococcus sp. BP-321]MBY6422339.1 isocitrate lyase/PEP mutase family protein [Rhodococcus sp. BP-324]MBY6428680.1 isocitrate lyase/PEP mutase family protein [Rhodococcus sp. BP-323]MBY6433686.1 isocitrate lyase/PEP mutase family protei
MAGTAPTLKDLTTQGLVYAPGVWDGLTARLAEQAGFSALCASGFAVSAALGLPDAELYTATENLQAVRTIHESSSLPLVADIDTGYGNAVNAARTARKFVDAGVQGMFMEDQVSPKSCPICVGDPVDLITVEEGTGKIRAVRDNIPDDVLLIARTDARGDDAIRRAQAYVDAGADMIMPVTKTFTTIEEWERCHQEVGVPLMATLTASTWTEREFTPEVLERIGVRLALLPTQILMAATGAAREALRRLAGGEAPASVSADALQHHEFVDLIGFSEVEAQQRKYLPEKIS